MAHYTASIKWKSCSGSAIIIISLLYFPIEVNMHLFCSGAVNVTVNSEGTEDVKLELKSSNLTEEVSCIQHATAFCQQQRNECLQVSVFVLCLCDTGYVCVCLSSHLGTLCISRAGCFGSFSHPITATAWHTPYSYWTETFAICTRRLKLHLEIPCEAFVRANYLVSVSSGTQSTQFCSVEETKPN